MYITFVNWVHTFLVVTLRSLNESEPVFKGFMIQGRLVADNSPVGTWQVQAPVAKTVCNGNVSCWFNVIVMDHDKMLIINTDFCHSC